MPNTNTASAPSLSSPLNPAVRGDYKWCLTRVHGGVRNVEFISDLDGLAAAAECQRVYEAAHPNLPWKDAAYSGRYTIGVTWFPRPGVKATYTCHNCKSEVPETPYVCPDCGRDVS